MPGQRADAQLAAGPLDVAQAAIPLMSMSTSGCASRSFIIGIRLCPPARILAPGAYLASSGERVLYAGGLLVLDLRGNLQSHLPGWASPVACARFV